MMIAWLIIQAINTATNFKMLIENVCAHSVKPQCLNSWKTKNKSRIFKQNVWISMTQSFIIFFYLFYFFLFAMKARDADDAFLVELHRVMYACSAVKLSTNNDTDIRFFFMQIQKRHKCCIWKMYIFTRVKIQMTLDCDDSRLLAQWRVKRVIFVDFYRMPFSQPNVFVDVKKT